MARKRSQDEEVFLFALKTVGSLLLVLVGAVWVDVAQVMRWLQDVSPDGSSLLSQIRYEWYMLF